MPPKRAPDTSRAGGPFACPLGLAKVLPLQNVRLSKGLAAFEGGGSHAGIRDSGCGSKLGGQA